MTITMKKIILKINIIKNAKRIEFMQIIIFNNNKYNQNTYRGKSKQ